MFIIWVYNYQQCQISKSFSNWSPPIELCFEIIKSLPWCLIQLPWESGRARRKIIFCGKWWIGIIVVLSLLVGWTMDICQQWYPYFWCIFRGWLPPRKHRYNIGRYIGQYIQFRTITKWTNGQNLGLYITKIGNIEDLRGHNVNVEHNNDIYGNITLSIIVGQ